MFDRFGRQRSCVCCTKQQPGGKLCPSCCRLAAFVAQLWLAELDKTRQTGFLFLVSCQIVAVIGPSPVIFCHCLNSPGLSFSFGTTGSPLLSFFIRHLSWEVFIFRLTVPQPNSFRLGNSWCKSTLLKYLSK